MHSCIPSAFFPDSGTLLPPETRALNADSVK